VQKAAFLFLQKVVSILAEKGGVYLAAPSRVCKDARRWCASWSEDLVKLNARKKGGVSLRWCLYTVVSLLLDVFLRNRCISLRRCLFKVVCLEGGVNSGQTTSLFSKRERKVVPRQENVPPRCLFEVVSL
jgi:hypothetical protein